MILPLYDFPSAIPIESAILIAPAHTQDGFLSRAGFENDIGIANAANQIRLTFAFVEERNGHWVSWLINRAKGGVFRIPIQNSPQLVRTAAIDAALLANGGGIPFSNGQTFSSGYGFKYEPFITGSEGALAKTNIIKLDMSNHPAALTFGQVLGHEGSPYHVQDIDYSGDIAEVEITPSLRRDILVDDVVTLRPTVNVRIPKINEFVSNFQPAGYNEPGELILNERLDANIL